MARRSPSVHPHSSGFSPPRSIFTTLRATTFQPKIHGCGSLSTSVCCLPESPPTSYFVNTPPGSPTLRLMNHRAGSRNPHGGPIIMGARVFLRRPSTSTLRESSNPPRCPIVLIPRPAGLRCNLDIKGQAPLNLRTAQESRAKESSSAHLLTSEILPSVPLS